MPASEIKRYQVGGNDVALAARVAGSSRALAVHLDRLGLPTDRFRLVEAHELRRIGTHIAEIKAAIAALPEVRFPWGAPAPPVDKAPRVVRQPRAAPASPAPGRGRLFAHNAIPPGDE